MDAPTELQQLLFRPRPNAGEDELAWLFRLARANGFRSAAALLSSARLKIASHITPISADPKIAEWAAAAIDVGVAELRNVLHDAVGAALGVPVHQEGLQRWRLGRGDSPANMVRFAVCPVCLRKDHVPYLRSAWRYAAFTHCLVDSAVLMERCARCGTDIGVSTRSDHELGLCHQCGGRFAETAAGALSLNFGSRESPLQPGLVSEQALPHPVASEHLYWDGIWTLLSQLLLRSVSAKLATVPFVPAVYRRAFQRVADFGASGRKIQFESLNADDRGPLLSFATWLCEEWPRRLVLLFVAAGLHWHTFSGRQIDAPYWIADVFRWHLQRSRYRPSLEEAQAARDALKSSPLKLSRIRVKRILGVTESWTVSQTVEIYTRSFSESDLALLLEDLSRWVESAPLARKQRASRLRDAAAIALAAASGVTFTQVCLLLAADVDALLSRGAPTHTNRWAKEYVELHRPGFVEIGALELPYFFVTRFGKRYEGYGLPAILADALRRIQFPDTWRGVNVFKDLHAKSPSIGFSATTSTPLRRRRARTRISR